MKMQDVRLEKAHAGDTQALTALWQQTFGDPPAYSRQALRCFAGPGHVWVARKEGQLLSMLLAVPCTLAQQNGIYLYALATDPAARGAGLMSRLMQTAEDAEKAEGARFSVLIPASASLYDFYTVRGYTQLLQLRHLELAAPPVPALLPPQKQLTADSLLKLRGIFAQELCVNFDRERTDQVTSDLLEEGALLAVCNEGYAVYFVQQEELLVAELFCSGQPAADSLLGGIAARHAAKRLKLTLPPGSELYVGQGKQHPAASLKKLDPTAETQYSYLRFAKDEVRATFLL